MEENENIQEENMQNETNQNVDNIQEELDNTTDRLKRLMAEFDNFKKRSAKERDLLYNSVLSDVVCKLLPVIDNLETAVNAETEEEYNDFVSNSKKASIYDTGIDAKYGDQLMTLSTCEYSQEDGRFAVVAKRIK